MFQSGSQSLNRVGNGEANSEDDISAADSISPDTTLLPWQQLYNPQAMNHLRQLNGISITETQAANEVDWLKQEGLYVSPKKPGGARAQTLVAQAEKKPKKGAGVAKRTRNNVNGSITDRMIELQPSLIRHRRANGIVDEQTTRSQAHSSSEEEVPQPLEVREQAQIADEQEQVASLREPQQQNGEDGLSPDTPAPSSRSRRTDPQPIHQMSSSAQTQAAITDPPAPAYRAPSSSAPQQSPIRTDPLEHTSPHNGREPVRCHPETLMFAEQGKKVYAFETYVGRSLSSSDKQQQQYKLLRTPTKRQGLNQGSAGSQVETRGMVTPPSARFEGTFYGNTTSPVAGRQSFNAGDAVETQPLDGPFEESQFSDSRPQTPARLACPEETQVLAYNSEQAESDDEATQPLDYTPEHTDTSEREEAPPADASESVRRVQEVAAPLERPDDPVRVSRSPLSINRASNRSRFAPLSPSAHRRAFAANQAAWDGVEMKLDNGRVFDSETFDLNALETMPQGLHQSTLKQYGFSGGNSKSSGNASSSKTHKVAPKQRVWRPLADDMMEDLSEDELTTETLPHVRAERREIQRHEQDRRDALRLNHQQAQADGLARQSSRASTRSGKRAVRASSEEAPVSSAERRPLSRKTSTNQSQPSSGSTDSEGLPVLDRLRGMLSTPSRKALFEE